MVEFLARVLMTLLTEVSGGERRGTTPAHNHISIVARQLTTAAVVHNQCFSAVVRTVGKGKPRQSTAAERETARGAAASAAARERETAVLAAAGAFHSLKCISAVLIQVMALPDGARTASDRSEAILLAAVLKFVGALGALGLRQGLTLVHFSAQPPPFLTQNSP